MKLNNEETEYYIEKVNESIMIVIQSDLNKYYSSEKIIGTSIVAVFDKIASPLVYLRSDLKKEKMNNLTKKKFKKTEKKEEIKNGDKNE